MNIQSFYEYVILRDILAYILPGGISLVGISTLVQAWGKNRWEKILPFFTNLNPFLAITFAIMIAFLIGHIWDMVYRLIFQGRDTFRRPKTIRKILLGSQATDPESEPDPIAKEIKESVGQFLNINWKNTSVDYWITSGKAYEANVLLAYWVEQEDAKLFSNEIARPIVQSHLLHVSGLAFLFLGGCALIAEIIRWIGVNPQQGYDLVTLVAIIGASWLFGMMLIRQGIHKRDTIVLHTFRVFHVVWRKRILSKKQD